MYQSAARGVRGSPEAESARPASFTLQTLGGVAEVSGADGLFKGRALMEEGKKTALGKAPTLGWTAFQPHSSPGQHVQNCP